MTIGKAKSQLNKMGDILNRCGIAFEGGKYTGTKNSQDIAACVVHLIKNGFTFS